MFGLIITAAVLVGAFFAFLYIVSKNADQLFEDKSYECDEEDYREQE